MRVFLDFIGFIPSAVRLPLAALALFVTIGAAFFVFGTIHALSAAIICLVIAAGYRFHVGILAQKTRQVSEASRIHLATVEALATAIDARDQVGIGHVRRTQIFAVGIGKALGLPQSDIEALRTGALLHDIGKLAIPDHILNKPERLTPAELEKTKIHSTIGAAILEKVGFDTPVIPTIKYHHERWDGQGYPEGRKGDQIPLTARVLSVADAFDTLRGARPYRPALDREKAKRIMQSEAGQRFDPRIVETLMRNLPALEAEIDTHGLSYFNSSSMGKLMGDHQYVEQIKLANREVISLYELAREFSSSLDLDDAFGMFARKLGEMVPFDTCAVYLLDGPKRQASAAHVIGLNAEALLSRKVRVGQGATGFALKSGETVPKADPDLDFSYSQTEFVGAYRTLASMPLLTDDEIIGAVTVYSSELSEYGEENIRLLETISRMGSEAIGRSLKHDEAQTHALTDPMTGLPNARSLQIQFDKEVARASRGSSSFQLLMLDLDGFKAVNDTFGHKVGDMMLKEVGRVIREQLRDYDFLARYGGDEFVALIPETSADDVADLCDRIEKAVHAFRLSVEGCDKRPFVGVSLGASGYPKNGETFDQMIVAADKVMYTRKANRKKFLLTHNAMAAPMARSVAAKDRDMANGFTSDTLIVELDETHVLASTAVN
jgi:diguanylate cyclase (GGDEF)-like protein/putative nucleotidyltransferase with HDIG domain